MGVGIWIALAIGWIAAAAWNAYDNRSILVIGFELFAGVCFLILGIYRYLHNKK